MKQKKGWTNLFKMMLPLLIIAASMLYAHDKTHHTLVETIPVPHLLEEKRPRDPLPEVKEEHSNLPFVIDTLCTIIDPSHSLDPFIDELDEMLSGKDSTIQIVHIGDSHVQAGFYSGTTMRLLQQAYGNAGRGWIAPYKLAKSNEPWDYAITSSQQKEWQVTRYAHPKRQHACGPGAISISTERASVDFTISISPEKGRGYEFNQVICYRGINSLPMHPSADEQEKIYTSWGSGPYAPHVMIDTFTIEEKTQSLKISSNPNKQGVTNVEKSTINNCFYGFVLTNGQPGILYHSIGQNGAMFINYTNREYIHQLSLLDPSLLIITLGTNESFGRDFNRKQFTAQMDAFVRLLREQLPLTTLLLTTPAECFKRKKKSYLRNEHIGEVAGAILQYAQKEGIACFDLYHMTGGAHSCKKWAQEGYMGRDHIHYTAEAYQEQGTLLYNALIRLRASRTKVMP